MIKNISAYKGICKISEYKKNRISSKDINKIIDFIKDCGLDTNNIYVDTSDLFNDIPYYFDGIFLRPISYSLINKEEKRKPLIAELMRNENIKIDETKYDYYKKDFIKFREDYIERYENGELLRSFEIPKKFLPMLYAIFFDKMSDDNKYHYFINIYKDYEHTNFLLSKI